MNQKMEESCLKWADLVICNTEPLRHSFQVRYPEIGPDNFKTLTNGYDDDIRRPEELDICTAEKRLVHSGSIYGGRRIDTFCQAVTKMVESDQLNPNSFRILFHGDVDSSSLKSAQKYASQLRRVRRIEFEPFIDSWQEAQKVMWSADVLLIFSGSRLEVPAKFYEYLKTGKPILAIAQKGALTELLDMTGSGIWADPNDVDGIARALLKVLKMAPLTHTEVEKKWDAQFHFKFLTGRLAGMLQNLSATAVNGQMSARS